MAGPESSYTDYRIIAPDFGRYYGRGVNVDKVEVAADILLVMVGLEQVIELMGGLNCTPDNILHGRAMVDEAYDLAWDVPIVAARNAEFQLKFNLADVFRIQQTEVATA